MYRPSRLSRERGGYNGRPFRLEIDLPVRIYLKYVWLVDLHPNSTTERLLYVFKYPVVTNCFAACLRTSETADKEMFLIVQGQF